MAFKNDHSLEIEKKKKTKNPKKKETMTMMNKFKWNQLVRPCMWWHRVYDQMFAILGKYSLQTTILEFEKSTTL